MDWKKNKNQHESSHSGDHHKALSPKKNLWEKDSNGNSLNQEHLEGAKNFADGLDLTSPVDEFELWPTPPKPRSFFLPVHYTASYRYPLIVWLHHDGFNEHQIDQIMPHVSTRNYIGIGIRGNQAADSAGHCFGWHDSPAAIDSTHDAIQEAIAEAKHRFSIPHLESYLLDIDPVARWHNALHSEHPIRLPELSRWEVQCPRRVWTV